MSGFSNLADIVNKRVAGIIEDVAKSNPAPGTEKRKIADLYASYMDTATIEAHGLTPIKAHLDSIAAIKTQAELAYCLGETLRADTDALNNTNFHTANLFGLWVAPGFNDPDHYTAYLMQGGLVLPDRAYYVTDSARMKTVREKYVAHIAAMLKLAGYDHADERAAKVLALETAIAEKHLSLAEDEDIKKANNVWQMADFTKKAPGLDWAEYFKAADLEQAIELYCLAADGGDGGGGRWWGRHRWRHGRITSYSTCWRTTRACCPPAFADERFNFTG